ncbi:MAG: APC family permease [Candidatus Aenigmarchaeota archaeon]|nr:APC family permease [Candidatus Aenigmarchaeota archaeon]
MGRLARNLSLLAVVSGALCSVIGGGINVLIVDIQNEVVGIGNLVPLSILIAGIVAFFISLSYSVLSSAMPKAGGEYVYVSRGLNPFLGFVIAFVKWASSVISIGAVAYMDAMILADSFHFIGFSIGESFLRSTLGSIIFSVSLIWFFWLIHISGVKKYGKVVTILMFLTFVGGSIIIFTNLTHEHQDFLRLTNSKLVNVERGRLTKVLYGSAILFWSYIGFTSISQAGGEIKNPKKNLPRAFILTSLIVTGYYFLYSYSFYHAVPWRAVVGKEGLTVPGLSGIFMPKPLAFLVSVLVALTLANDIPPMLLTTSRLFYSWAVDGIVPKLFSKTNENKVPYTSLLLVTIIASFVVVESVFEGFFLAINVVSLSRFFAYILIALSLLSIESKNPKIFENISFLKNRRKLHYAIAFVAIISVTFFLVLMVYEDLVSDVEWYEHTSLQFVLSIIIGAVVYFLFVLRMKKKGIDYKRILKELPEE